MKFSIVCAGLILFVVLAQRSVSAAEPTKYEDRVNDLHLNRLNVGRYSVIFEATSATLLPEQKESPNVNLYLGRQVMGERNDTRRLDCFRESISDQLDLSVYYHILQHPKRRVESLSQQFGEGKICDVGELDKHVMFEKMDSILQSQSSYISLSSNRLGFLRAWQDAKVIEESTGRDGVYNALLFRGKGPEGFVGVAEVFYAKEPEWAPVHVNFLTSIGAKERLSASPTAEEYRKKLIKTGHTSTKWKSYPNGVWLPDEIRVVYAGNVDEDGQRHEIDIRFTDWKFGKDFDSQLLDREKFTADEIKRNVDFAKWKAMFAQPQEKAKR